MGLSVFSVTPAGLLFVCVLCLAAEDTLFSALLLAAAVHELGHLAAMAAAGYRPERITLEWMGVSITCGLMPPGRELVTALAGPAASFLLSAVAVQSAARMASGRGAGAARRAVAAGRAGAGLCPVPDPVRGAECGAHGSCRRPLGADGDLVAGRGGSDPACAQSVSVPGSVGIFRRGYCAEWKTMV